MSRLESDQAARGIKSIDKVLIRKGIGKPETIKVQIEITQIIQVTKL